MVTACDGYVNSDNRFRGLGYDDDCPCALNGLHHVVVIDRAVEAAVPSKLFLPLQLLVQCEGRSA
jgi:hypothetical protein